MAQVEESFIDRSIFPDEQSALTPHARASCVNENCLPRSSPTYEAAEGCHRSPQDESSRSSSTDATRSSDRIDKDAEQLSLRLEAAVRVAQKSLHIQQGCIAREKRLQKQLHEERERVRVLTAERDLLLAQRVEMLASAKSLETYVRRWSVKEKEYKAKLEEGERLVRALQEAQQQMLVQIDELSEEVRLLRSKANAPAGYKNYIFSEYGA